MGLMYLTLPLAAHMWLRDLRRRNQGAQINVLGSDQQVLSKGPRCIIRSPEALVALADGIKRLREFRPLPDPFERSGLPFKYQRPARRPASSPMPTG